MSIDWNTEVAKIRELRANRTKIGPGERPAVVVVDFQRAFTELESIGPPTRCWMPRVQPAFPSSTSP
jgi:maleamate amidohydrolase